MEHPTTITEGGTKMARKDWFQENKERIEAERIAATEKAQQGATTHWLRTRTNGGLR